MAVNTAPLRLSMVLTNPWVSVLCVCGGGGGGDEQSGGVGQNTPFTPFLGIQQGCLRCAIREPDNLAHLDKELRPRYALAPHQHPSFLDGSADLGAKCSMAQNDTKTDGAHICRWTVQSH